MAQNSFIALEANRVFLVLALAPTVGSTGTSASKVPFIHLVAVKKIQL